MEERHKFGTRAIHAGQAPDPATGAVMIPVYQTSTYAQESPGAFKDGYDYSRTKNPTRTALEENLASLEGAKFGICFASGCSALSAVLHLLKAGDHVLVCDDVYGGTFRIFDKIFKQLGIEYSMVNMSDVGTLGPQFRPQTKLVWVETPTNPMLQLIDIAAVAAQAKKYGALLAVDNTFASPFLQNPLSLGADIVSHSTTKYIGGHSDLVGGALMVNDPDLAQRLHYVQNAVGAVPGIWECFLLLRSTKTLHLRMERHCANARAIADLLEKHPQVERVYYPGLKSHPQHELAKRQMRDFGGMISCVIKGGIDSSRRFLERLKIFAIAESLGGVESLVEHPAIMTHAMIPTEQREALGIVGGLVRLSVGVEDIEDLIADLNQALEV